MGASNKYWTGSDQARIPNAAQWVAAAWGSGRWSVNKLDMINAAFEIYYLAKQSIEKCADATQKLQMTRELEDAANDGCGRGIQDLDDAFEHWLKPGKWTDENVGSYNYGTNGPHVYGHVSRSLVPGGRPFKGNGNMEQDGPLAAVHFLNAVDDKMAKLKDSLKDYGNATIQLFKAFKGQDLAAAKDAMEKAGRYGTVAKPFLWWMPAQLKDIGGKLISYGGALLKVYTFNTNYRAAQRIFDDKTSLAFAALCEAAGAVPVLGAFYKTMIEGIPGLAVGMQDTINGHYRDLDKMVQDATFH